MLFRSEFLGGSADLASSNLTLWSGSKPIRAHENVGGNYLNYGVREFGMSAIMNGIALHGVAGPDSLEGHPAGTVFIGIADRNQVRSIKVVIGGRSRSDVRYISTLYAFNLVRQALLQETT